MQSLGPTFRISLGLVLLTGSILLSLDLVGVVPKEDRDLVATRVSLAEVVAAQTTASLHDTNIRGLTEVMKASLARDSALLSVAVRTRDGRLLAHQGNHRELWRPEHSDRSTTTHVRVPVFRAGDHYADLELRFRGDEDRPWYARVAASPLARLVIAVCGIGFVVYTFYMRRTLRQLDPSSVIPTRVKATLDIMTEGVLILSKDGDIVLSNQGFADRMGYPVSALLGKNAASLPWRDADGAEAQGDLPWVKSLRDGQSFTEATLTLNQSKRNRMILQVNGAPVFDGWGQTTGAVVTFDDVTERERQRKELERALTELEKSRDEVRLQNEELRVLAQSDPLTGVANRRSFMEAIEPTFASMRQSDGDLCCVMVDIDHFKRINDTCGHQTGDEVIRAVADTLRLHLGGHGLVCRYGGEEFCVALGDTGYDDAFDLADRVRRHIESPGFAMVPVTASFGVASVRDGAMNLAGMIDQADQALYASKEGGRNQVTRFDAIDTDAAP